MFSIILPAYNEADNIESSIKGLIDVLETKKNAFEIIIAEDGSTDGTDGIATRLAREHASIKHLHSDRRLGRGLALKRCGGMISGDYPVYMDVDLAPEFGEKLTDMLFFFHRGFDIVVGSRYHESSNAKRTTGRKIASKAYNLLQRVLFRMPIRDLQCGFKGFRKNVFIQMNKEVAADGWFWDTEILIRAFLRGYSIREIPVEWREGKQTKVKIMKDSWNMGISLIRLWLKLKFPKQTRSPVQTDYLRP
jgi:glycosyltransferase involved in cell wall biosynthesis